MDYGIVYIESTLIIVLNSSRYHAKTRRSYFSALLNFSSSNLSSTRSGE